MMSLQTIVILNNIKKQQNEEFISMNYNEFEKKPFGLLALILIISSWSLYVYFMISAVMNEWDLYPLAVICMTIGWLYIQLLIWILGTKMMSDPSVVMQMYDKLIFLTGSIIRLSFTAITELVFRKYYLKFYNFIKKIDILQSKLEENINKFKEENEKLR